MYAGRKGHSFFDESRFDQILFINVKGHINSTDRFRIVLRCKALPYTFEQMKDIETTFAYLEGLRATL